MIAHNFRFRYMFLPKEAPLYSLGDRETVIVDDESNLVYISTTSDPDLALDELYDRYGMQEYEARSHGLIDLRTNNLINEMESRGDPIEIINLDDE